MEDSFDNMDPEAVKRLWDAAMVRPRKVGVGRVMIFGTGGGDNEWRSSWFEEQLNKSTLSAGDVFMDVDAIPKGRRVGFNHLDMYGPLLVPAINTEDFKREALGSWLSSTEKEAMSQDEKYFRFERFDRNK